MANLAQNPAAALVPVNPALRRDVAGVDADQHGFRSRLAGEAIPQRPGHGREAAVEADLEEAGRLVSGHDDAVDLGTAQAQRLLHQHRLAGGQGPGGQLGVAVVAGGDEDRVDFGVVEDRRHIRCGRGKPERVAGVIGHGAFLVDQGVQPDVRHFFQLRKQDRAGETAGADGSEHAFSVGRRRRRRKHRGRGLGFIAGIGEDHAQMGLGGLGNQGVGVLGPLEIEAVRDQRRHVQAVGQGRRHQADAFA